MSEILQENQELLNSGLQELWNLKMEIKDSTQEKNDENPYKELIEHQKLPMTHGNRNNPEISITFDDGYGTENIEHILNTLRGSGIKATFFILGDCLKNTPELWKDAREEGHQICCHTFSHIYLSNNSDVTSLTSGLNKDIRINERVNNVKTLLGDEYYDKIKNESGPSFPNKIKSTLLLETEILMWESQVKNTLGEEYLQNLKQNYPFFRFPGGCGANRSENIDVLKRLGYLAIGWSDDFYRGFGKNRRHMSVYNMSNMNIQNGDIPLFHFKKDDYKYIDAYIENMKNKNKSSHEISGIIK